MCVNYSNCRRMVLFSRDHMSCGKQNFSHSITNLKVRTILYDCCVCAFSYRCGLNCETINGNATAIVQTTRYFNREIGILHLGTVKFRVAINLHLTSRISYGTHTAARDRSFSQLLALLQSFSSGTPQEAS